MSVGVGLVMPPTFTPFPMNFLWHAIDDYKTHMKFKESGNARAFPDCLRH